MWIVRSSAAPQNRVCLGERKVEACLLDRLDAEMGARKLEYEKSAAAARGKTYKSEIAAVRGKLARLKELYLNELISLEEYRQDREAFTARLNELEQRERPVERPNLEALDSVWAEGWQEGYREMGREKQREFWRLAAREIRIYPDRHIEFELND